MKSSGKTVWIINQYGSLPSTGIGGRHRHLSRELSRLGHKVTLVSARWTHGTRDDTAADSAPEQEVFEGFRFLRIPVSKYKHAHDKKRIVNWFVFAWRIAKLPGILSERPDVIIYSSPSLFGYLSAYRLAKKYNARLIFEVRDIWPLTLIHLGGYSPNHPFIRLMQWVEDFAYRTCDHAIANGEGVVEHMVSRGLPREKFTWIPNGYSEEELSQVDPADDAILDAIKKQPFSVTYTGAIGEANSLDTLISAAEILKERSDIHFNIVGRGRLAHELEKSAQEKGLFNVHFWGSVPKSQVQSVLQSSDVCVICWRDSVLYKHGLAANKLFDYLYSGRPVINAYSGGYDIVERYQAGVTVPAENPVALSKAVESLAELNSQKLLSMGERGRRASFEYHEYGKIAAKLNCVLTSELSA
ncbi:MAG: glycosyltransferase family 4 protein [Pseudomonadota bacterium]